MSVVPLFSGARIIRPVNLACLLCVATSLTAASPSSGQPSARSIKVSDLIGCWDREPTEEQARQDEEDGFADTFELCFDVAGGVEAFNLGGGTEYGIEGYSDVFTYRLGDRLSFFSDGQEDSSCLAGLTDDFLELSECRGSYFQDNTFRKVSRENATSTQFD